MNESGVEAAKLNQIAQEAEQSRAQASSARRPAAGTDDSGMVTVGLDRAGRLTRVQLDNSWERTVGADGLGAAILAAYRNAAASRAEAWADAQNSPAATPVAETTADHDPDIPEADLAPPLADPDNVVDQQIVEAQALPARIREAIAAKGDQLSDEAYVSGLLAYIEDADDELTSTLQQLDALSTSTATGRSRSGRVEAVVGMIGGEPQSIELDSSWSTSAHPFNISREVVEAVNDAQRVAAMRAAEDVGTDRVAKYNDPQRLLQYLNLT